MTDLVAHAGGLLPGLSGGRRARPLTGGGVTVDAGGAYVFRHEPSDDPARLQMFHQREIVRIGEPDAVAAWREHVARPRGRAACASWGWTPGCDGRHRSVLRAQRADARGEPARAGAQVRGARADRRPRADRGGVVQLPPGPFRRRPTGSRLADGGAPTPPASGSAWSGSSLALLRAHGLELGAWPARRATRALGTP